MYISSAHICVWVIFRVETKQQEFWLCWFFHKWIPSFTDQSKQQRLLEAVKTLKRCSGVQFLTAHFRFWLDKSSCHPEWSEISVFLLHSKEVLFRSVLKQAAGQKHTLSDSEDGSLNVSVLAVSLQLNNLQ